jgi:hypothetical protein
VVPTPAPVVPKPAPVADRDGDRVVDSKDACPTRAGATKNGCPRPTDKDQCKKDGWKSYGPTFKNQGECVSYTNAPWWIQLLFNWL